MSDLTMLCTFGILFVYVIFLRLRIDRACAQIKLLYIEVQVLQKVIKNTAN